MMPLSFLRNTGFSGSVLMGTVGVLLASGFLSLAAYGLESATRSETNYSYLSQALDERVATRSLVQFDGSARPIGRDFTDLDRAEIGIAATRAWANLSVAYASGEDRFLEDHFDDTALQKLRSRLQAAQQADLIEGFAVLDQLAHPRFFHADGSVFEMKSDATLAVRYLFDHEGEEIEYLSVSRDCTRQVLFLQTVGWKIRNHELDCSKPLPLEKIERVTRNAHYPMKGINYYPADMPWKAFWAGFDADVITRDIVEMHRLGANSIRIFLPYDYFTDPLTRSDALRRFSHFLYLAGRLDIQVMPTLFDFRGSYAASGWAQDYRHLADVLSVIKDHDNVAILDLKNEPDLDYQHHGKALVDAWLITFSTVIQQLAPELSVTIGWLDHSRASQMHAYVDVVSYHEYGNPDRAGETYRRVGDAVAGKPVLVTEIGKPSWSAIAGLPFSDASQSDWLSRGLASLHEADGVFVWTLHDFEYADTAAVADLPWRRAFQASYGLIDHNGNPKPSAAVFRAFEFGRGKTVRNIKKGKGL